MRFFTCSTGRLISKIIKSQIIIYSLIFSISVYPEGNHEIEIRGLGYDLKEVEIDKLRKNIYDRDMSSIFVYSGNLRDSNFLSRSSKTTYDLQYNFLKNTKSQENLKLFLGNNFYMKKEFSKFEIILGRKSFSSLFRSDPSWKDGIEGMSISTSFKNGSSLNIYLFDVYRGFPLLRNEFYISKKNKMGDRLRYGLEYNFENRYFYINYHFSITQFWNWGRFSLDRQDSKLGDGDFLYHNSLTFGYRFKLFNTYFSLLTSRGVDKTTYDPIRKSSSLLFSGEAIQVGLKYEDRNLKINTNFFLPDSNKKNSQGEILELGYVGMGAFYSDGFLISQILNFLPSNWVTGNGLEVSDSIKNGSKNSYFQKIHLSYNLDTYKFFLISDLYVPYKDKISLNGNIYYDKKYFSNSGLHEITGGIETGLSNLTDLTLKFQISYLFPSFLHPFNGTSLFFSCALKI